MMSFVFEILVAILILYVSSPLFLLTNIFTFDSIWTVMILIKIYYYNNKIKYSKLVDIYTDTMYDNNFSIYNQTKTFMSKFSKYKNLLNNIFFHDSELSDLKITLLDKYAYILLLMISYYILTLFFWFNKYVSYVSSVMLFVLSLPSFLTIVTRYYYFVLFSQFIREEIRKLYLFFLCKITAKIINKFGSCRSKTGCFKYA